MEVLLSNSECRKFWNAYLLLFCENEGKVPVFGFPKIIILSTNVLTFTLRITYSLSTNVHTFTLRTL